MTIGKTTSATTTGVRPQDVESQPDGEARQTREPTVDQLTKGQQENQRVRVADGGQKRTGKSKPRVQERTGRGVDAANLVDVHALTHRDLSQVQPTSVMKALVHRLRHAKKLEVPDLSSYPADRVAAVRALFRSENLRVSVAQPQNLRDRVVAQSAGGFRFKSQWETHTSSASLNHEKRGMHEAFRFGLSINTFNKIPMDERPVCGYLQFNEGLTDSQTGNLHIPQYGEDIWEFQHDAVEANMTVTVGDSWTRCVSGRHLLGEYLNNSWSYFRAPDTQVVNPMTDPHEMFLPYSDEFLPAIHQHVLDEYDRHGHRQKPLLERDNIAQPVFVWRNEFSSDRDDDELTNYYEVQLHDPDLNLSKVGRFTFTDAPPKGEFLEILRANNIEIFDWRDRDGDPKPWVE